ncbi:MerR family DNA-binding protein [Streptomyces sp. NPDC002722]|uniref:MerR family DNA-binding protein n=1 Tax=Streptomyces sp. NPDC002722 TaxID=3154425 RepID=UPI00331A89E2
MASHDTQAPGQGQAGRGGYWGTFEAVDDGVQAGQTVSPVCPDPLRGAALPGIGRVFARRTGRARRGHPARLAFIGAAEHLGLPLEDIGELLAMWEAGACADVKADLRPRVAARLAEAEQRTAELAAFTATLHTALDLEDLVQAPAHWQPGWEYTVPPTGPPPAQPGKRSRSEQ